MLTLPLAVACAPVAGGGDAVLREGLLHGVAQTLGRVGREVRMSRSG